MNNLFTQFGVYVDNEFLDTNLCDQIVEEMHDAPKRVTKIVTDTGEVKYNTEVRNTLFSKVSKTTRNQIDEKLNHLKPKLEAFYNQNYIEYQPSQYLMYDKGHKFKPHQDVIRGLPPEKTRKITVIIFLNQQLRPTNIEGDFGGGGLYLFGLMPQFPKKGFEVPSQKGLLLAFKSDLMHEVTPVTFGNRCTLVSWLV